MSVIYKYTLEMRDVQEIQMPQGGQILHVGEHQGKLCLWVQVDTRIPVESRVFEIVGTGQTMPYLGERKHIGTVVCNPMVWHVFEVVKTRG